MQKRNRRWFLASLAATGAATQTATYAADSTGKARIFPSSAIRYIDPATEFTVLRLTDPQFTSSLPAAGNRALSAKSILFASDMGGGSQAFSMDLHSKESRQLTEAKQLDRASLALAPKGKAFWHFDGPSLIETQLPGLKTREVYRVPDGFDKLPGASFSDDGQAAAYLEKGGGRSRLRLLRLANGTATTLVESPADLSEPLVRPRHSSLVYRNAGQLWSIDFGGQQHRRVPVAEGTTLQADWAADGHELQYLNRPTDPHHLTALRAWVPETNADARLADTTQYLNFDGNADASAFVGASGSKASPYVLLLIRSARRELTLAEHRASDPAMVHPLFAPNSQFVVFVSDRHSKPAIYWMAVDKLVTETGGE